jgi:hypothetical protein
MEESHVYIISFLGGVEVLLLFLTLRKIEELHRLEKEIHDSTFDLALALALARDGRYEEAKTAAERWRDRCRPFRQGERRHQRPRPQTAPPPPGFLY